MIKGAKVTAVGPELSRRIFIHVDSNTKLGAVPVHISKHHAIMEKLSLQKKYSVCTCSGSCDVGVREQQYTEVE